MFEKEKKQYEEDCKNYERPWELWQWVHIDSNPDCEDWKQLNHAPSWWHKSKYRRKPTTFKPEYYSGLNWRDAEHLIGKTVEYTNHPDSGWHVGTLKNVSRNNVIAHFEIISDGSVDYFIYIRTWEEAVTPPTINIGGVELPKPETVAPAPGTVYWMFGFGAPVTANDCSIYDMGVWPKDISRIEKESLKNGAIHLTEKHAKAWADWWKKEVINKIKG